MTYETNIPDVDGSDNWNEHDDAYDAESAAVEAGKGYNEDGDYSLMNNSVYVRVREVGSDRIEVFCVSAEPDVHYSACVAAGPFCKGCNQSMLDMIRSGESLYCGKYCNKECYTLWQKEEVKRMEAYKARVAEGLKEAK